ncbi:polycomb group protein EMBRYONIC FLOWER 2-like isoform X2 [Tasmannia lanceolata]|uniref:polycomb group protein EMBRYONIC FLOWER 2-like isoform X2 n=1 Tax=Tasmannia lanceolata TaxID=3420 RepID=UPI0040645BF7
MPGLPLVAHETTCSHSRTVDQMCRQDSRVHLSVEEAIAAEESLSIYCKPVELYNIIQRRALHNPSFLQRCLHYKIQARRKKRLRSGIVIFNYRYYNNTLQKTEVTEDFSCPFCLVQCASFKGLRYHLNSSHDLFNFEFWVTNEYQAVNVSVKTDFRRSEVVADGADPRLQIFFFCSKPHRCRRSKNLVQNANHVHPQAAREGSHEVYLERDVGTSSFHMPTTTTSKDSEPSNEFSLQRFENDVCYNEAEEKGSKMFSGDNHFYSKRQKSESCGLENPCSADCTEPVASSTNIPGKLSAERADPRNCALLQKRQFFHSRRAQPMALDQVLSDRDSEDEVEDDIADFEDRRMLDDFVDVTKDEKHIMHLWNSFVRKQRCWRLVMIKLWNHSLLDANTMNNCNLILESYQKESADPKQS